MKSKASFQKATIARLGEANEALRNGRFVLAVYLSGVAVECMFRAYAVADDVPFDAKHDLPRWLKRCRSADFVGVARAQSMSLHVMNLWARWKNRYRYADESSYIKDLRKMNKRLVEGIKGSAAKENARQAVNAANYILNPIIPRWK